MAEEEVEIRNVGGPRGVASEATLLRLLEAAQEQNSNRTVAARTAARLQDTYNKRQKEGAGIFAKTAEAAKGLASEFVSGGDRVSDFSRHVLGAGSTLQSLIEYADGAVDQFRSLSSVGAGFNNSIFDMMVTAATAGMRLDEFYNVVQNNSEVLRMLGGTVTSGAKEFSDLSKSLRSSDLGRQLFDLGFTVSDINDGMLTYIENQALQGRLESMTQQQLIRGSREYLEEIDALAKATGMSREALMQQTNELQNNAEFQALLSRAGDGADQLTNNMAAVSRFMPGFTSDLISIADGFQGSELAIALNQMGSSGQQFLSLLQRADDLSEEDFLRGLSTLGPDVADAITGQFDSTQMRLLRQQGSPIAAIFDALSGMRRMGNINVDQMIAEQEQRDQITSILGGFSDALARIKSEVLDALLESAFADRVRDLSNSLGRFLTALFGGETPGGVITGAAGGVVSGFNTVMDALVGPDGILTRITGALTTELEAFTTAINSGTPPMDYLRQRAGELGEQLKNWFMDMFFGPEVGVGFEGPEAIMERRGGLLDTITTGFSRLFDFAMTQMGFDTSEGGLSIGQQMLAKAVEGMQDFFNGPMGQDLKNTIGGYFQTVVDYIVQMLSRIPGSSLVGIDHAQVAADVANSILSGEGVATSAGFSTMLDQLPSNQFTARELKEMIPEGSLFAEDAPMLTNMLGFGIDRGIALQNLMRQAGDMSEEDLIANFGPNYQERLAQLYQRVSTRAVGTLRATGKNFEPENVLTKVNQGERVLNPRETAAINELPAVMAQLNTLLAQIRDLTVQSVSHQERTARGIKRLGGDIMGAA